MSEGKVDTVVPSFRSPIFVSETPVWLDVSEGSRLRDPYNQLESLEVERVDIVPNYYRRWDIPSKFFIYFSLYISRFTIDF